MKPSLRLAAVPLVVAGATASLLVFASVGCGSGGGTSPAPGYPTGLAVSSLYSGKAYTGQVSLENGQVGNVSVTVSGTTASGTLEIVDPSRKATAKSRIVIATPFLSGTFDPLTGAINLSGSYTGPNGQTVTLSITGTLPVPPSTTGGSVTVTLNGQSYTTTFGGNGTNPTPTPSGSASPSPTPSASPSASPSPSPLASPPAGVPFALVGGTAAYTFSDVVNTLVDTSPIALQTSGPEINGAIAYANGNQTIQLKATTDVVKKNPKLANYRTVTVFAAQRGGDLKAGTVFDLANATDASNCNVSFQQIGGEVVNSLFIAKSGKVTVVNVTARSVVVKLENVDVKPSRSSDGDGGFTINGDITGNVGARL